MATFTGEYSLEGIKYFFPIGIVLKFDCPACGATIDDVDLGDGFIEYPQPEQKVYFACSSCGETITLRLKIRMQVTVDVETVT
jgi:predicted RNA-binding Zn-ribbon protein involved in translation (DUF1610 family)